MAAFRVLGQDLLAGLASRHQADDGADGDTHAADARLPAHYAGITGDPSALGHQRLSFIQLSGLSFPGEPYALSAKDGVARYLEAYVAHFALPVRLSTGISSLVRDADRFVVTTEGETFTARSVIVATGS